MIINMDVCIYIYPYIYIYIISNRYGCFGDVTPIPKAQKNPKPGIRATTAARPPPGLMAVSW